MRSRLAFLLVLTCLLAARAHWLNDLTVDGEWGGASLSLRLRIPSERLADFDDDRDRRLSLKEIQSHRVPLRERLLLLLQVRSGGLTLRPSMQPWEAGNTPTHTGILLFYGLSPSTNEITLRAGLAGEERCLGRIGSLKKSEAFALTSGQPERMFRSFEQGAVLEYFLALGVAHIMSGYDHLLFLVCLLLPATSLLCLIKTLTAFTLAHSLTLALTATGLVTLPTNLVESSIAASIAVAAGLNLARPQMEKRWPLAFGFGLLHGLGFGSALVDLNLSGRALVTPLVGFNVGVELGQVLLACLAWPALVWLRQRSWGGKARQLLNGLVLLLALGWTLQRI